MAYSAFEDKAHEPQDGELVSVLGSSADLWQQLISEIASRFSPLAQEWVFSGRRWGWALRLKYKKRAILYMTPAEGLFHVGLALGEKAVAAAHASDVPAPLLEIIDGAQRYMEGRALRLEVRSREDLETALTVARIKMTN